MAQYGSLAAFMAAVAPKKSLPIPDLHFTEEENQLMDEILTEEQQAKDRASGAIEQIFPE